jgi:hypothetical protein
VSPVPYRIQSPDRPTYDQVSKTLSRLGVSVAACLNTQHAHVINGLLTNKARAEIEELGAEIEVT